MINRWLTLATLAMAAGCTDSPGNGVTRAADLAATEDRDSSGHCWATEITPAVYEEVMGQVQVVQAQLDEDGAVLHPPVYRNAPVPRLVSPRSEIRFEAPCPETLTPGFIATLQRALYARGYLRGAITGEMDPATTAALRRYQSERGLDSAQLSLQTARDLGLIAVDLDAG